MNERASSGLAPHARAGRVMERRRGTLGLAVGLVALCVLGCGGQPIVRGTPVWQSLSSASGDLPQPPGGSTEQTSAVVGDFDGDGVNDFILGFRRKPPALVWYRRTAQGWDPYTIEKDLLTIEAGGAVHDVDGDGDLDVVFGGDWQSNEVWWWENPAPDFDRDAGWNRRAIKTGGAPQHHDQVFGDFLGTGKPQLAFWNQRAQTLYLAEVPEDPRSAEPWPLTEIVSSSSEGFGAQAEGLSAFDIDADGRMDLLAYNSWLKHTGGKTFKPIRVADVGGLILAGYFKPSAVPQIVVSPGDGNGPLRWHECAGDPEKPGDWKRHDLLGRKIIHGHSLQLGDVNRDGHLDIFAAEMAEWGDDDRGVDHPGATAWIFYGDGGGRFAKTELIVGHGWHEARLRDLDGDGDLDLLNKPYTWNAPRVDVWLAGGTREGAKGAGTSRSFPGPLGLELYSLRDFLETNVPLGLQTARCFGFLEVELPGTLGVEPEVLRSMLSNHGLKPVSALWDYETFAEHPERVIDEAEALGVEFAGTAWIPHQDALTETDVRRAASVFNAAGEALKREGVKFFYHNHGFEFVPHGDSTLFDLLVAETDPELVSFEMDIFWAVHPGQDPVKLLRKHAGRWALMHVKDMREGTETGKLSGHEDVRNDVALGTGQIDVAAALREAARVGVRHFFIEDESPDAMDQIPQSIRYLESLEW